MSASEVEVLYELYEKKAGTPPTYEHVTAATDVVLEAALRDSDRYPFVANVGDVVEQTAVLHTHVQAAAFDFPVLGHVIAFGDRKDTRWDPDAKSWVTVIQGGSLAYPVVPPGSDPADARLYLEARTANAVGEDADALVV